MQDKAQRLIYGNAFRHVRLDKREQFIVLKVLYVPLITREKVVETNDPKVFLQEPFSHVRPEKTCDARYHAGSLSLPLHCVTFCVGSRAGNPNSPTEDYTFSGANCPEMLRTRHGENRVGSCFLMSQPRHAERRSQFDVLESSAYNANESTGDKKAEAICGFDSVPPQAKGPMHVGEDR